MKDWKMFLLLLSSEQLAGVEADVEKGNLRL